MRPSVSHQFWGMWWKAGRRPVDLCCQQNCTCGKPGTTDQKKKQKPTKNKQTNKQKNKKNKQRGLRQDGSLGEPDLTALCDMNIAPSDLLWENDSSSKSAIFTARETFQTQRSVLNADLLTSGHHHPYIKCSFMFPCW